VKRPPEVRRTLKDLNYDFYDYMTDYDFITPFSPLTCRVASVTHHFLLNAQCRTSIWCDALRDVKTTQFGKIDPVKRPPKVRCTSELNLTRFTDENASHFWFLG
jgi:hypothetical protein